MKVTKRLDTIKYCENLACPAILKAENGDIIIIGTDVTNQIENLSEFNAKCAPYEKIVRIPQNVLKSIIE